MNKKNQPVPSGTWLLDWTCDSHVEIVKLSRQLQDEQNAQKFHAHLAECETCHRWYQESLAAAELLKQIKERNPGNSALDAWREAVAGWVAASASEKSDQPTQN